MKLLVETSGAFSLNDSMDSQYVDMNRPCVVLRSHFMNRHIGKGAVIVLSQLSDAATDEAFLDCWSQSKGDKDLAVAAFAAEFPVAGKVAPSAAAEKIIEDGRAAIEAAEKAKADEAAAEKAKQDEADAAAKTAATEAKSKKK